MILIQGKSVAFKCATCNPANDGYLYQTPNTAVSTGNTAPWIAQPVTIASAKCVTGIEFSVGDGGAGSGVTCMLYTDVAGSPGAIVGVGFTATIANVSDSITAQEFLFAATQYLPAGTYWMIAHSLAATSYNIDTSGTKEVGMSSADGLDWAASTSGKMLSLLGCSL